MSSDASGKINEEDEVRKGLPPGLKVALVNNLGDGTFVLMQTSVSSHRHTCHRLILNGKHFPRKE